jgi:hypothetical protein
MPSLEWNRWSQRDFREFRESNPDKAYGVQWGDPEVRGLRYFIQRLFYPSLGPGRLYKVVDRYIRPYVNAFLHGTRNRIRWRPLDALLGSDEPSHLRRHQSRVFRHPPRVFRHPQGDVPERATRVLPNPGLWSSDCRDDSVDFVFSFGTFVHIEPERIREYLIEIQRVLRSSGTPVIQYAEKRSLSRGITQHSPT